MTFDFDLFVIGGGSGGVRAARVAATEVGVKVGLAEGDRYGGTCVIRGCVPKKLMVFASEFSQVSALAQGYGWDVSDSFLTPDKFNWSSFHQKQRNELDRLEGIYRTILKNSGVESFDSYATISGPNEIRLADGKVFTAKYILVATGGKPMKPSIEGVDLCLTSDELFHLKELPKRILIIGGGYIACEFACIFNGLGCGVTQYIRGEQILRNFDREATDVITEGMIQHGVHLEFHKSVASVVKNSTCLLVKDNTGQENQFDAVLMATGRTPNVLNLGLDSVGVQLNEAGAISVNEYSQTSCPSIYAIGDVTNRVNLTPVAIREAMAFVDTVFKANPTKMDHTMIPSAVFTQPEMGCVGLSEEQARVKGPIEIYKTKFNPMYTAFAGRQSSVFMKLVVSKASRVVLGCHLVAPHAGELIQMIGIAIKMGATKEDFDRTVAVHPTMSEEIVTMRNPV